MCKKYTRDEMLRIHIEELVEEYVKFYTDLQKYSFDNRYFIGLFEKLASTLWQILAYEGLGKGIYEKDEIINKSYDIGIIKEKEFYLYIQEVNDGLFSISLNESKAYKECIMKNHHYFLEDIKCIKNKYLINNTNNEIN